jgi:RNA polymerase sigma-70 factor (ECF subfamily)
VNAEELDQAAQQERPRLIGLAYRMTGSLSDAEDIVQEALLRAHRSHVHDIESPAAYLTTITTRLAIDHQRSARVRREAYVGPWLPEPQVQEPGPADQVTLDDTVRYALLVVLEQLTPAERTAWVLHDLFGFPFDDVARVVGRSPAAVRQLASRARRQIAEGSPRVEVDQDTHDRVVTAFVTAVAGGDLAGLVSVLDPDVVLTSDGGGVVSAARRPVFGPDHVGRFMVGLARKRGAIEFELAPVNGDLGLVGRAEGRCVFVIAFTVDAGLVARVDIVLAPDKLGA